MQHIGSLSHATYRAFITCNISGVYHMQHIGCLSHATYQAFITCNILYVYHMQHNVHTAVVFVAGTDDCTDNATLYSDYNEQRCPSEIGKYLVPVLMGIYVLMTNVLLLNLLIAMFRCVCGGVGGKGGMCVGVGMCACVCVCLCVLWYVCVCVCMLG